VITDQDLTDQFLALVYADSDLLRAEFEAIVADWDWPGAARVRRSAVGPTRRRTVIDRFGVIAGASPADPEVGGWARERSPPSGCTSSYGTEGQVIG
jgi:hypothetical protein